MLYLPALLVLIDTAWPVAASPRSRGVYLTNCWAYRRAAPVRGDWVWLRLPPRGALGVARVVAVAGQELEWTGRGWRIDGRPTRLFHPLRHAAWPRDCLFRVPAGQVLVEPREDGNAPPTAGWLVLVPQDQIIGRAWARYHPVWERRLL